MSAFNYIIQHWRTTISNACQCSYLYIYSCTAVTCNNYINEILTKGAITF